MDACEEELLRLLAQRDAVDCAPFHAVAAALAAAQRRSDELDNRDSELASARAESEQLRGEVTRLQDACGQAGLRLRAASEVVKAQAARLSSATADIIGLRSELAESRALTATLGAELVAERRTVQIARDELAQRLADKEAAEERLARLRLECADLRRRVFGEDAAGPAEKASTAEPGADGGLSCIAAFPSPPSAPLPPPPPLAQQLPVAPRHTLRGCAGGATHAIAWRAAGEQLATAGEDGRITIWDSASGRSVYPACVAGASQLAVAWPPWGQAAHDAATQLLLSGGADRAATLWDLPHARRRCTLPGHTSPVVAVAAGATLGRVYTAAAAESSICMHDISAAGASVTACIACGPASQPLALAAAPPSSPFVLASAHVDGTVRLWDARMESDGGSAAKAACELPGLHSGAVTSVSFGMPLAEGGSDGGWTHALLTAGADLRLCLVDLRTRKPLPLSAPSFRAPRSGVSGGDAKARWQPRAALSAGAAFGLAGGGDGRLTVWDLRASNAAGGAPTVMLKAHTSPVTAVAWRPGWHPSTAAGAALASADKSGAVLLWER